MSNFEIVASSGRKFAPFAAAVAVVVVDERERILLLGSNKRGVPTWEVPSGALEANETILDAARREIREELGPAVSWRPLGVARAYTIGYDDAVTRLISVVYVAAYESGGSYRATTCLVQRSDGSLRTSSATLPSLFRANAGP